MRALLDVGAWVECWCHVNVYIAACALLFLGLELNPFNMIVVFGRQTQDKALSGGYRSST